MTTIPRPTPPLGQYTMSSHGSSNFRSSYYAKLGIFPPTQHSPTTSSHRHPTPQQPPIRTTTITVSPPRPTTCLRRKNRQPNLDTAAPTKHSKNPKVSFHPQVRLYTIRHHRDYSDNEWHSIWVDAATLAREKTRNALEFRADGGVWRLAREEAEFHKAPDGSLHHPATWSVYRHQYEALERAGLEYEWDSDSEPFVLKEQQQLPLLLSPFHFRSRPKRQRKAFWLLELAMDSIQHGKNAVRNNGQPDNKASTAKQYQQPQQACPDFSLQTNKPRRQADRGWP